MLDEIKSWLTNEIKKPKYESQCIMELKEIKHLPTESLRYFDKKFKTLMARVSLQMSDVQHKERFIVSLLPHIWVPLMQPKIVSQIEALEIAMKLQASPIRETGNGMV